MDIHFDGVSHALLYYLGCSFLEYPRALMGFAFIGPR